MLGTYFYNSVLKNVVVAFGDLFNNINVRRFNSADGTIQELLVPIHYAPKEMYLASLRQSQSHVSFQLPAMSYEIVSLSYDSNRKTNTLNRIVRTNDTSSPNVKYTYNSVPYNVGISLNIFARNSLDGYQIVEQVIPFFTPEYTLTIETLPELDINKDMPIVLEGISPTEEYEFGQDPDNKKFVWSLDFTLSADFYGPVRSSGIIKRAIVQTYIQANTTSNAVNTGFVQDPTSNTLTQAYQRYIIEPNPAESLANATFVANTNTWYTETYLSQERSNSNTSSGIVVIH